MTADLYLARHAYLCALDDSLVILDSRADAYLAISPRHVQALSKRLAGASGIAPPAHDCEGPESDAAEAIRALVTRGVLTANQSVGRAVTPVLPEQPCAALAPGVHGTRPSNIQWADLYAFLRSFLYVAINIRLGRLDAMLCRLRESKEGITQPLMPFQHTRSLELLEIFRAIRTLVYTAHDACLFNALTLTLFLHRHGLSPTFVIGVRSRPFSAHAWVQLRDVVLDDRLEAVQNYTPIVVL